MKIGEQNILPSWRNEIIVEEWRKLRIKEINKGQRKPIWNRSMIILYFLSKRIKGTETVHGP